MNFKLDDLRDEPVKNNVRNNQNNRKPPGNNNNNGKIIAIVIIAVIFVGAIGGGFYFLNKPKNPGMGDPIPSSTPVNSGDVIQVENPIDIPMDHSGNLITSNAQISSMSEKQFIYEIVSIDTVCKVEKAILYSGSIDGSSPKANETLKDYIERIYTIPEEEKTDCQKFYMSLWGGKEEVVEFSFEFLKERKFGDTAKFNNAVDYFSDYAQKYFNSFSFNNIDVNKNLKAECSNFLLSIKKDSLGFYDLSQSSSFKTHIEDFRPYVPEGSTNVLLNEKTGQVSFSVEYKDVDATGEEIVKTAQYFSHQSEEGVLYYNSSKEKKKISSNIGYMNRWEESDFYFYRDRVSMSRVKKGEIDALIEKGYTWTSSNILEKKEGNKDHKIEFTN